MKTKILTLIILALGTFSFAQSLDDESGYLIINNENDTVTFIKSGSITLRSVGTVVEVYRNERKNPALILDYPDFSTQFSTKDDMKDFLNKAFVNKGDSTVLIYDGSIVDSSKIYSNGVLQYFIDYDNDGTNITTIKY